MQLTALERVDPVALLEAISTGSAHGTRKLLEPLDLPAEDGLTGLPLMLNETDQEARFLGVQCLVSYCRFHGDVQLAAHLAHRLVHTLEREGYFDSGVGPARRLMAGNVLDLCASCMPEAGLGGELLRLAPHWTTWLHRQGLADQWRAVQRARVEAALHAGLYELAAKLLKEIDERFPDARCAPIERRLRDKLDDLLRPVDQPDAPSAPLAWVIKRTLEELGRGTVPPEWFEEAAKVDVPRLAERIGRLIGLAPTSRELNQLRETVRLLPSAGHPFHQTGEALSALSDLLTGTGARTPDDLAGIAQTAGEAQQHAIALGFWEEAMSLGWLRSIALRRAGRLQEAALLLRELRASIRERQQGVTDPRLRAALAVYLPHLFSVSSGVLFGLGPAHAEEMFSAIEQSKARVLGDLITRRFGEGAPSIGLTALRQLLERPSPTRVAYLTMLLDDSESYAVLVDPAGSLHPVRLSMGREVLTAAVQELGFLIEGEPGNFVREAGIDPDRPWDTDLQPVLSVLQPLGEWLATLLDRGVLRELDILCISPDGPLFNLPLGAMEVGGAPLLEHLAITMVPSAEVLARCAEFRGEARRSRALAMVVPRSTEFDTGAYDLQLYRSDAAALAAGWTTTMIPPELSDRDRLLAEDLSNSLVHIAGHGGFDPAAPLQGSGLALAYGGHLPPGRGPGIGAGLFTPNHAEHLRARGAHVTLRACVSGRTTEVTSREALGMIWALFQAGASSIAAASWHTDIHSAAALLAHMYRELSSLDSPVLAHRAAALAVRRAGHAWSHPYHYAAFNHFGYWT